VKRLTLIAALVVAGALAATASAAAPSQNPTLIEAKGPAYPVKTYVLQLPSTQSLTSRGIDVTENGSPVLSPTLVPASHASREAFGTVLVLDTSYSMAGDPLAAAVDAEQTFASHRNPNEQLLLHALLLELPALRIGPVGCEHEALSIRGPAWSKAGDLVFLIVRNSSQVRAIAVHHI